MIKNIVEKVRQLAKLNEFQNVYAYFKEGANIRLFNNDSNFSEIQLLFLNYLSFYNNIFTDIALGEVTDFVLSDPIYEDSYVYFKHKNKPDYTFDKTNRFADTSKKTSDIWVFKSPRRRK